MSTGALTIDRIMMEKRASYVAQRPLQMPIGVDNGQEDQQALLWRQIDEALRIALEQADLRQPDTGLQRPTLLRGKPHVGMGEGLIVVAPGIAVPFNEYKERYDGIDLDAYRRRMPPELFKAFVRHAGVIPGHPDLDVAKIATIPE